VSATRHSGRTRPTWTEARRRCALRLTLALAAAAALALLVSACGGSSGEGVAQVDRRTEAATTDDSSSDDPTAFSACMRRNGVPKFPDPDSEGRFRVRAGPGSGIDPESAEFKAAEKVCGKFASDEPVPASPDERAELQEQLLEFSACMRSHGLPNFPDPDGSGGLTLGRNSGLDPDSPRFREADRACADLLPVGDKEKTP
jgi:hypothetical protein